MLKTFFCIVIAMRKCHFILAYIMLYYIINKGYNYVKLHRMLKSLASML